MQDQPKLIDELCIVIDALLEQCKPNTQRVLGGAAVDVFNRIKSELIKGEENAAALETIKAEQKAKGK